MVHHFILIVLIPIIFSIGIHRQPTINSTKTGTNITAQTSSNLLRTHIINVPLEGKATGDFIKIYKRDSRKKSMQQNSSQNTYEYIKVIELNQSKIEDIQNHSNVSNGSQVQKSPDVCENEQPGVVTEKLKDVPVTADAKTSQGCRKQDSQENNKELKAGAIESGKNDVIQKLRR